MAIYEKKFPIESRDLSDQSLITDTQRVMLERQSGLVV